MECKIVFVIAKSKRHFDWWRQRHMPLAKRGDVEYVYREEMLHGIDNPNLIFLEDWEYGYKDPERLWETARARIKRQFREIKKELEG